MNTDRKALALTRLAAVECVITLLIVALASGNHEADGAGDGYTGMAQTAPTPEIWQPPTRTPSPSTSDIAASGALARANDDSPFATDRLLAAALDGVKVAVAGYILFALLAAVRAASRGELGQWVWWVRREIINPLLNRRSSK